MSQESYTQVVRPEVADGRTQSRTGKYSLCLKTGEHYSVTSRCHILHVEIEASRTGGFSQAVVIRLSKKLDER